MGTTDDTIGAQDIITTGQGNDIAFGGVGTDYINVDSSDTTIKFADDGNDILIGDSGWANFTTDTDANRIATSNEDGSDDYIYSTQGQDILIGSIGNDTLTSGTDNQRDIIIGDQATITFSTSSNGRFDTDTLITAVSDISDIN